jgi:hypothetical protein
MFIVLNEGHRGALLACTPEERATGGRTPSYRVRDGRLVRA